MRIVMLGASGNAGREVTRLLSPELTADDELVLAGRDPGRLEATRTVVSAPAKVSISPVDAFNDVEVRQLFAGADLVVVTASLPERIGALAQIALDAGADWIDTLLSTETKLRALRELEPQIVAAQRCFVTDGGFHPGVPAAMVRWAADQLDELDTADVFGGMRIDWRAESLSESTVEEMLLEFTDFDMGAWIEGERRTLRWRDCPRRDFGPPIGSKVCVPMSLAEMDGLPDQFPGLRQCGFYISGFSPAMDYVALPILMTLTKVPPLRPLTRRLMRWSLRRLASPPPPHRMELRLEAAGRIQGRPATATLTVSSSDPYVLTAAPVVACLRQLRHRERPGLWLQALLVSAPTYFTDLAELGLDVNALVETRP